jgi:multiple sugar transport system substrate-binding protein
MRTFLAGILLGCLALCGCGRHDENTVRFMYWGDLKEIEIVNQMIEAFKKENPGIKVENQRVAAGGPQYDEKLTTLFAGRQEPEVFLVSSYYASKYAQYHAIADLSDLAQKSQAIRTADFYPEILKEFELEGRLYVIPRDIAPVACLYYNKAAFKSAGQPFPDESLSWPADFARLSQKLTRRGADGKAETWGYVDDWDLSDTFIYSAGGSYVDDPYHPRRVTLDSKAAMEGIQFRADLCNLYKSMPSEANLTQAGSIGTADMFKQGKAAMFYSGSWHIPDFRDITAFEWDIALPPKYKASGKRAYCGGGSGYAISARAQGRRLANAWKLVEFLTKPESSAKFAASGLVQPADMKVAEGPGFIDGKAPAHKKLLLTAVKDCYVQPRDQTRWREIRASGLDKAINEVFSGEKRAVDAMPGAVKAANEKFFPKK